MSAKSDKKRDDKYAKQKAKRERRLARHEADRTNSYSKSISEKDKAEALKLFTSAQGDLGTARAGVDAVINRVTADSKAQTQKDTDTINAAKAAITQQLGSISQGNDASAANYLSQFGIGGAANTGASSRNSQFNQMLSDLTTQYALDNLQTRQYNTDQSNEDTRVLNSRSNDQFVKDFTNQYNDSLNKTNRDLSDSYDKTNFDLVGQLNQNRFDLNETLKQNNLNYQKAREAERAAAAYRIRGNGGYGYGGGLGSGLGATSVTPAQTPVKAPSFAQQADALNKNRIKHDTKGGYWWSTQPKPKVVGTWNQRF